MLDHRQMSRPEVKGPNVASGNGSGEDRADERSIGLLEALMEGEQGMTAVLIQEQ